MTQSHPKASKYGVICRVQTLLVRCWKYWLSSSRQRLTNGAQNTTQFDDVIVFTTLIIQRPSHSAGIIRDVYVFYTVYRLAVFSYSPSPSCQCLYNGWAWRWITVTSRDQTSADGKRSRSRATTNQPINTLPFAQSGHVVANATMTS